MYVSSKIYVFPFAYIHKRLHITCLYAYIDIHIFVIYLFHHVCFFTRIFISTPVLIFTQICSDTDICISIEIWILCLCFYLCFYPWLCLCLTLRFLTNRNTQILGQKLQPSGQNISSLFLSTCIYTYICAYILHTYTFTRSFLYICIYSCLDVGTFL